MSHCSQFLRGEIEDRLPNQLHMVTCWLVGEEIWASMLSEESKVNSRLPTLGNGTNGAMSRTGSRSSIPISHSSDTGPPSSQHLPMFIISLKLINTTQIQHSVCEGNKYLHSMGDKSVILKNSKRCSTYHYKQFKEIEPLVAVWSAQAEGTYRKHFKIQQHNC